MARQAVLKNKTFSWFRSRFAKRQVNKFLSLNEMLVFILKFKDQQISSETVPISLFILLHYSVLKQLFQIKRIILSELYSIFFWENVICILTFYNVHYIFFYISPNIVFRVKVLDTCIAPSGIPFRTRALYLQETNNAFSNIHPDTKKRKKRKEIELL